MIPPTDNGLGGSADLATGAATQVISKLTPLRDVLATLDTIATAASRISPLADAVGAALSADLVVGPVPAEPVALLDGFAVRAEETQDAGGYAPVRLSEMPVRVAIGDRMPISTDTVAQPDVIRIGAFGAEILEPTTVGDGCATIGADWLGGILRKAGERLRNSDIVVLAAAGISQVQVRKPRIMISAAKRDAIADAVVAIIARDLVRHGVVVTIAEAGDLTAVFERTDTDAIVTVGGTGSGSGDDAIIALRRRGRIAVHGIALSPGETSALGFIGERPVLMVPGRVDAALAAWLAIGRAILARLSGVTTEEPADYAVLSRKITSTIGISDLVPVVQTEGKAEPLAARYLPLSVLARADGWVLVPPESEGYPAGSTVTVNAWL